MHSLQPIMCHSARCARRIVSSASAAVVAAPSSASAAAAAVTPACLAAARPSSAAAWRSSTRSFSRSAHWQQSNSDAPASATAAADRRSGLLPSQAHIVLPQLSPRMERGAVLRWLVSEGSRLEPHQVFAHIYTRELTEDGSPYILEIESHESGIIKRINQPPMLTDNLSAAETDLSALDLDSASSSLLAVGSPIALFEDPDWTEGDRARGEFLWQAYVSAGKIRKGSCTPQRAEEDESGAAVAPPAAPSSQTPSAASAPAASADATMPPTPQKKKRAAPKKKV